MTMTMDVNAAPDLPTALTVIAAAVLELGLTQLALVESDAGDVAITYTDPDGAEQSLTLAAADLDAFVAADDGEDTAAAEDA